MRSSRPKACCAELTQLDALVLAVSHKAYLALPVAQLSATVRDGGP
jgi:hypothetical protein